MLLHRGHGSILSGFLRVFSGEFVASALCSVSVLAVFDFALSSSIDGVIGFTLESAKISIFVGSSVEPSCSTFSVTFLDEET